jgi:hypothetical protein
MPTATGTGRSLPRERRSVGLGLTNADRYYAGGLVEELALQTTSTFRAFRRARASYDAWLADPRPAAPTRGAGERDPAYKARWEDGPRDDKIAMVFSLHRLEALLAIRAAGLDREAPEFRCGRKFDPSGRLIRCEVHTTP